MDSGQQELETLLSPTRRNPVWFTSQMILRLVFLVWFRYRARGMDNLPSTGGCLLLMNHQSFLDPLLVGLPLQRPVSFLGRHTLFPVPIIGWILRRAYVMPIKRSSGGTAFIREMVRRIRHGFLVGIFPEGTRCSDGSVGELKPGFIALARRAKSPIVPVGIAGAHEALPRGALWLRPRTIRVVYGAPIDTAEVERLCRHGREQEFLDLARVRIVECQRAAKHWRVSGTTD